MSNWLDSSNNANSYKSMYVNGFIDISGGNVQTRNADNHLLIAGDSSFNSNLSLGKDLSIGIENPQYAVDISGTVDLKDNLLMRGDISLNKTLAAQNAGTLENHNYSEPFDDYDNLILKTDQSAAEDTANDEFTSTNFDFDICNEMAYLKSSNIGGSNYFGRSVAISGDYVIVGAYNESSSAGAAYIFKTSNSGETWTQKAYLTASNANADDYFGYSLGISGDYAIVGAYKECSNSINDQTINHESGSVGYRSGAVYIFKRDSGAETWTQKAYLKASNIGTDDYFGYSVAINGDYAIVGAYNESSNSITDPANNDGVGSGAAYIFKRDSGAETWTQTAYLKASNIGTGYTFGYSVAMDGDYVIVGAYSESGSAGAAYIFKRDSGAETWTQKAYLKASNRDSTDYFGWSVAISGDNVIVGAHGEDSNSISDPSNNDSARSGAAYIFKTSDSGETWTEKAYLKSEEPGSPDQFGTSVAINGDSAIVGSPYESSNLITDQDNDDLLYSGATYIFKTSDSGESWDQTRFIKASNMDGSDNFGQSVAVNGDYIIVGAAKEDSNSITDPSNNSAVGSGAAYIFKAISGSGSELTAPTAGANNMVLSDDGNRYAYIHGWTGATQQGAGTGGTLKVRSYNNGWSEDTVNDSGSLSVSTGNGSKNLYISGDGNVIVTAQVDSENYDSATDSTNGKIYMWIRNSSTNQWDRTIINIDNTLITGTPKAKNFNNWMTGGFGGVAVNYDGTRIAFSNAGVNDDNSGDASDLFVFGRSGTTLTYLGGLQTSGWGKICRCIFTKTGDKLFVGNYTDNDVKIYTIDSSSISLSKTITTSGHTTAGQLGINETGTKMVYLKDNTNFTVRTTSDNWVNSTETTKTYPSSREFNHVGGASSNQKDFYGRWLDMSPNGNTMMVSTITGDNKRGRVGVYDISDLNSITEVKYLDAEAGTYNDDFKVGNNVVCKNTHYGFTANAESSGNWKSYNVFKSYDPTPTTNYYNQEFKGGNLFLNGNLTIDGTLSVGAINATGNTITYDADTTMNKRLYVNSGDISMNRLDDGFIYTGVVYSLQAQNRYIESNTNSDGYSSVAISSDASYVMVGAPDSDGGEGKVQYLNRNNDGTWSIKYSNSGSSMPQRLGECVSITHDGEYAVASMYPQWQQTATQLRIYKRATDGTWSMIKQYQYQPDDTYERFCIQKRDDGDIYIFYSKPDYSIGSYKSTNNGGYWSNGSASTNASVVYKMGHTMKINNNCTRMITCNNQTNKYYIFNIGDNAALTQIGVISMTDMTTQPSVYSDFAEACNISGDGSKIIVSAGKRIISIDNNTHRGIAQVFEYVGGGVGTDASNWSKYGPELYGSTTSGADFGKCVALNTDGTIALGASVSDDYGVIYKYRKITQDEWTNSDRLGNDITNTNPILLNPGTSWDENTDYWYQYGPKLTTANGMVNIRDVAWGNNHAIYVGHNGADSIASIWNIDMFPTNVDLLGNYQVASNINTSGSVFADVSLNHNLVVPGNITIVDGSANNYGAYTTFTNNDATAYFNVGKSASNVFNIVDNNNVGVYMASDGNSMTSTSDERLKTEIESLDDPTEKLMQLKPCTYKWKTQEDDKKHVGFIAQEVEKVLPELVNETTYPNGDSYKGVATSDLIPYLIKSIQERQLRINKLENK